MAVTTGWMWQSINRNRDYSIVNGSEFFRENWQLVRYRVSDAAYTSQLGSTASSLSADNGGVTESVTAPTEDVLTIVNTSSQITWSGGANYDDYTFYPCPLEHDGNPIWYSETPAQATTDNGNVDNTYVPVVGYNKVNALWYVVLEPRATATSGLLTYSTIAGYGEHNVSPNLAATSNGWTSDSGDATSPVYVDTIPNPDEDVVVEVETNANFRCISDLQSYNQQSVDWYTQIQTWTAVTRWKL